MTGPGQYTGQYIGRSEARATRAQGIRGQSSRRNRFSKSIITILLVLLVMFIAYVLDIFARTGQEPVALIAMVGGFAAGEFGLMAWLRRSEIEAEKQIRMKEVEFNGSSYEQH